MDSVEINKNFVETDLSDSMILVQDEAEAALNPSDLELCRVYHSCCLHDHDLLIKNDDISHKNVDETEEDVDENVQEEEDDKGQEDEGEAEETIGETLVNLDEDECIDLKTPEWTEERVHRESISDSDCDSKSTNLTSLDDSLVATSSQQQLNNEQPISKDTAELSLTENMSEFEDKTDLSSSHGLDEMVGEDTVDSGPVQDDYNEETVGLISSEQSDQLEHNIKSPLDSDQLIKDKIEIHKKAILINLTDPLAGKRDDQMSLVTKHSTQLYRHANYSGISSYTGSTSSTSNSSYASHIFSTAKRARKAVIKQVFGLLKKSPKHFK